MALKLEEIRALAARVAGSHGLEVVDVEYQGGGGKHRTLRVFIEKNEAQRAILRDRVARLQAGREDGFDAGLMDQHDAVVEGTLDGFDDLDQEGVKQGAEDGQEFEPDDSVGGHDASLDQEDEAFLAGLPSVRNLEFLSGITHEDCELFSRDFGTVLDIEELVPGTEYLLEVSSPGLDRRLTQVADYRRFTGSLVKLETFEPVGGNRHWQGRIVHVPGEVVVLELGGKQSGKKLKKGAVPTPGTIEIAFGNVEKAHLVPEF